MDTELVTTKHYIESPRGPHPSPTTPAAARPATIKHLEQSVLLLLRRQGFPQPIQLRLQHHIATIASQSPPPAPTRRIESHIAQSLALVRKPIPSPHARPRTVFSTLHRRSASTLLRSSACTLSHTHPATRPTHTQSRKQYPHILSRSNTQQEPAASQPAPMHSTTAARPTSQRTSRHPPAPPQVAPAKEYTTSRPYQSGNYHRSN